MKYAIGIDPGTVTGWAVWDPNRKRFFTIRSGSIIECYSEIRRIRRSIIKLRIEDARKRTWFGGSGRGKLQGAGSIKRDCKIWEEICEYHEIPFEMVHPKNNSTKLDSKTFKAITGYKERTNEHKRDAAMLVYQYNKQP